MTEPGETYAITTVDLSGAPHVALAPSRDLAISHFMALVYQYAHAVPDGTFRVVGDDEDAALAGLHLIWIPQGEPCVLVSLTAPAYVECKEGWAPSDRSMTSFVDIARDLDATMVALPQLFTHAEGKRLQHSMAAMSLRRPMAELLLEGWCSLAAPVPPSAITKAWADMKSPRLMMSYVATVVGDEGAFKPKAQP